MVTFIALNVGGVFFNTTKETLLKHGDGYFSNLFNNAMERKRIHDDKELLEDLLTEAEFFGINKLVNDIKSLIDPGIEKIRLWQLEEYLRKGYHVITTGRYSNSNCRHTSVELVEDNAYFVLVTTNSNIPMRKGIDIDIDKRTVLSRLK
nr:15631_t:CDS:2 [Entrophospora candida]